MVEEYLRKRLNTPLAEKLNQILLGLLLKIEVTHTLIKLEAKQDMKAAFENSQDEKILGLKIILLEAKRFSDNKKIHLPDNTTNHIKNLNMIANKIKTINVCRKSEY